MALRNQRLVSQNNFGFDLAAVEAAAKKYKALETNIFTYEKRVQAVVAVAVKLETKEINNVQTLLKKQQEMTDELKNYISAINAPPSKPQSSKKKTGKDCDEPAGEDPRPASAAHVPPGLRGVARQD